MRLGVRSKLFFTSLALIVLAGGISVGWLETNLRTWLDSRTEDELRRHALSLGQTLGTYAGPWTVDELDAYADRVGQATGLRVTIIDEQGAVLGDSQVPRSHIESMDPHDARPEVVGALSDTSGRARRFSHTIGLDMLYVAVVFPRGDQRAVVRVAMNLEETGHVTERLRTFLLLAGGLGLLVALLMSGLAAHLMARALGDLVRAGKALAEGGPPTRLDSGRGDELGKLATYMDRLAVELQEQMERVVNARDRFAAVLEAIDAAVIALDEQRRVTMVNAAAEEILNLPSEPNGRPLIELVPDPALHEFLDQAAGGAGEFSELDLALDTPLCVQARIAPFRASEGAVLILHDISRIRHLETVRRDFVANVSHELRTPLSIILANTEMLLDGALEDEAAARNFLGSMHRSARRLTALVSDLLDLSRIESGSYAITREPVVLSDTVERVFEAVNALAKEKQASLFTRLPSEMHVLADAAVMEQVVLNLVDNAVKYGGQGGSVVVAARACGSMVRVEVSDTGPGVPAEHRARLFERFYRVDPGRSRAEGGTGLGLAIVKHLVNSMGGDVGMEPSESGGALFWFELPGAPAQG